MTIKVNRNVLILLLTFAVFSLSASAQEKYWVMFNHKNRPADPGKFLSRETLQRRMATGANICDSADWPVDSDYILKIKSLGVKTGYASRWINALAVTADDASLAGIRKLSFVRDIQSMHYYTSKASSVNDEAPFVSNSTLLDAQIESLKGSEFIRRGIDGKGIRIAVFDGGFPGVDTNPVFEHLRKNHQIVKTYDFVKKKEFVYDYMSHGTSVLSCIAGIYGGKNVGLATGAEFLLARTEVKAEVKAEEEYWMAAMEWADQNGADIISSSLGYTDKRYTVKQMNGHSTLVTRAAAIAARKGMLVINAMGNDGRENWEVMGAPADADSVLSIGGIDPFTGYHINFSSFGPTSDYRLKPNVCAPGSALVASPSAVKKAYGTSFSTPLVAGFAACVWQMNRNKNNMEIFNLVEKSGHLYPYFDYAHGYGIPQATYFFKNDSLKTQDGNPVSLKKTPESVEVTVSDLSKSEDKYMNYLYYHIQKPDGVLKYYAVLDVTENKVVSVPLAKLQAGDILRVYYKGFIHEMQF